MMHVHLEQCDSTQKTIFELIDEGHSETIVSCERQTSGTGRRERSWFSADLCLALSLVIKPSEVLTMTSLELGVLARDFVENEFGISLKLKWPNDMLTKNGRKCGGILAQSHSGYLVVGIGLNLFQEKSGVPAELKNKFGCLFSERPSLDLKTLSLKMAQHLRSNRISVQATKQRWLDNCAHLNSKVLAQEGDLSIKGRFIGIGDHGQALLENEEGVAQIYNASLFIDP